MAPCCFCFLLVPWLFLEAGKIAADPNVVISPLILLANAAVAFGECLLQCLRVCRRSLVAAAGHELVSSPLVMLGFW